MNGDVRPWAAGPVPVPTGAQAVAFDADAVAGGIPSSVLMERAGAQAAELVVRLHGRTRDRPVLVVAGMGNNGADALVTARTLASWGVPVHVLRPRAGDRGLDRLHGWDVAVHRADNMGDEALHALFSTASSVVDGLLGTGLTEAPRPEIQRIIDGFVHAGGPILALDLPSGVVADDGRVPVRAVQADATLAFGFPKMGTLLHPGRASVGRLIVAEIGFPPLNLKKSGWFEALTPHWAGSRRPRRRPATHKNQVGALTIVAGGDQMAGAALLAARAGLRAGAGYVRVISAPSNRDAILAALPDAVFVDRTDASAVREALEAAAAIVAGPAMGTGAEAAGLLKAVLAAGRPTVLDADALTLLAASPVDLTALADTTILTPHPGEAGRLLGVQTADVEANRPGALDRLTERYGVGVILKGTPTLVAVEGRRYIDTLGSSDLAVAGMGDTLAGAVGSFLAQGLQPAAAAGVGLVTTARAAALANRGAGLQATDVPAHLPDALAEGWGDTDLDLPWITLDLDSAR